MCFVSCRAAPHIYSGAVCGPQQAAVASPEPHQAHKLEETVSVMLLLIGSWGGYMTASLCACFTLHCAGVRWLCFALTTLVLPGRV